MKPERKIQRNLLFSLLLILMFSTISFSQASEPNEESDVIPERVMKQIVRKVLIHYFKPRNQKKIIYLSEDKIQQSWLPKIKGIEFQLFDRYQHRGQDHYIFDYLYEACAQLNICFFNNLYLLDELLNRPFRIYKHSS
jgi:hypothetical protein